MTKTGKIGRIITGHLEPVRIGPAVHRCDETPIWQLTFDCGHQEEVPGLMTRIPKGYTNPPSPAWTGCHPDAWDGWIASIPGSVAYCPRCMREALEAMLPPDTPWWDVTEARATLAEQVCIPGLYIGHLEPESQPLFIRSSAVPTPWAPPNPGQRGWQLHGPDGRLVFDEVPSFWPYDYTPPPAGCVWLHGREA